MGDFAGGYPAAMTGTTNGVKELEEEHYSASAPEGLWLNGIATNSRMSGDALKYPERAAKANPINYVLAAAPPF